MRNDAVCHLFYCILSHRTALVIEFAHSPAGLIKNFDIHAKLTWNFFQITGNGNRIQGCFQIRSAFFMRKTKTEGICTKVFQNPADIQPLTTDFCA